MDTWNGILTIIEIQHRNSQGDLLWEQKNIRNLLHQEGEHLLLGVTFAGMVLPTNYYLGLDNRSFITATDVLDDLIGEPTAGGYQRQEIPAVGAFALNLESHHYVATSPIVTFRATVASWGPVSNLFLATTNDNTGSLISTAILGSAVFLTAGDNVTMRIGMRLRGCS